MSNLAQADVVNHYRIGPDPDHVRKLVEDMSHITSDIFPFCRHARRDY